MTKRLTAAAVARYRAGAKRRAIADGRGLYLLIQPTGGKSWCMFFRGTGGRMVKLTLGPLDESGEEAAAEPVIGAPLSLAGARRLAADVNRQRALGRDVVAQRESDKAEREAAGRNTFPTAARDFITQHSMAKVRGWREQARLLGLDADLNEIPGGLCSRWRDRFVASIDGDDVHRVIDEIRKRGVPGLERHTDGVSEARARHAYSCLSRLFSWLIQHRRAEANPCAGVARPETPRGRERVLSDDEIAKFWRATDAIGPPFSLVLRLLLITGQRLNEIGRLRWEEIVGDDIHLPGSRTKNHRGHVVPLSSTARDLLAKAQRHPSSPFVFTTTGHSAISGWSKCKHRLDVLMGEMPPWRLHDLRRTAVTGMARAGADLPVIERAVNHISGSFGGIVGVYQKHKFEHEVRAALQAWADLLARIVS